MEAPGDKWNRNLPETVKHDINFREKKGEKPSGCEFLSTRAISHGGN